MAVPIISFVGLSNSGKTTLIERVIPELVRAGYKVATVKHSGHGFDLDTEGKDSWRHKRAGASSVCSSRAGNRRPGAREQPCVPPQDLRRERRPAPERESSPARASLAPRLYVPASRGTGGHRLCVRQRASSSRARVPQAEAVRDRPGRARCSEWPPSRRGGLAWRQAGGSRHDRDASRSGHG